MCISRGSGIKLPEYETVKTPQAFGRRGVFDFDGEGTTGASAPQFASSVFNPYQAASAAKRKSFLGA